MICYLARHGKDDETLRGGWSQCPLTEEGKMQVAQLADFLRNADWHIHHIYSSDLLRAMQTAGAVADKLGMTVEPMPEFREVNNGDLAGMKNELAKQRYPGLYWSALEWDACYPNGESPRMFFERISWAWECFQRHILEQNGDVLLVTHGGVINVILSIVNGEAYTNRQHPWKIGYAQLLALEFQDGSWKMKEICQ